MKHDDVMVCEHTCTGDAPDMYEGFGHAVTNVYVGGSGWFWIGNDEYGTAVAYCPFCGAAAPAVKGIE